MKKEKITEEMKSDRDFIIAAVSCDLIDFIREKHADWLDNGGYQPYYDLVIELVDHMLFREGSTYLKFLKKKKKDEDLCFTEFADDCFDWFHMRLATKLVTEELLHSVCFGNPKEYFEELIAKEKEIAEAKVEEPSISDKLNSGGLSIGDEAEITYVNDFQSVKYSVGKTLQINGIADVGSDNSLYVSEDLTTWFHPSHLTKL